MRRAMVALAVILFAIAALGYGGVRAYSSLTARESVGCDFGSFSTDTGQASVASTMVGVVVTRHLPERAAVLVIAAALQESKLRNIAAGSGDRDSVGVLQQRPSQGWGTAEQLADVSFATGAFLDRLIEFTDWSTLPLPRAIQNVQISADEDAYAKHEARAQAIADALTGATPRGVSCNFDAPSLVAQPTVVASALQAALPVNAPTVSDREISVSGASWATAAWFVANGDRLGVAAVTYSGARWERGRGWTDDTGAGSDEVRAQMY